MASTSRPSVFPPPAEPPKRSSNSDADKNSACFCVGRQITSLPSTISGVGDNGLLRCNDDGFTDGLAELFAVFLEHAQVLHGLFTDCVLIQPLHFLDEHRHMRDAFVFTNLHAAFHFHYFYASERHYSIVVQIGNGLERTVGLVQLA